MFEHIAAQPLWIEVWIYWLFFINGASVLFLSHAEARWVLAAALASVASTWGLELRFGDSRAIGLAQLVWWTPLVVYLFRRRAGFGEGGFGGWARLLVLSDAAALLVGAVGLVRLLLGNPVTA